MIIVKQALLVATLSVALSACANPEHYLYACIGTITPAYTLVQPVSGATGVPDGTAVLVYSTTRTGANGSPPSVVRVGTTFASSVVASPTAVPAVTSSPNPYQPYRFAVTLPALEPATTYAVFANITSVDCGSSTTTSENVGTFTTQ